MCFKLTQANRAEVSFIMPYLRSGTADRVTHVFSNPRVRIVKPTATTPTTRRPTKTKAKTTSTAKPTPKRPTKTRDVLCKMCNLMNIPSILNGVLACTQCDTPVPN